MTARCEANQFLLSNFTVFDRAEATEVAVAPPEYHDEDRMEEKQ